MQDRVLHVAHAVGGVNFASQRFEGDGHHLLELSDVLQSIGG